AAADCAEIGARAFAHGSNVYFGAGQYQPETVPGRWLLAHEIVHTQQSVQGVISRFQTGVSLPTSIDADDATTLFPRDMGDAEGEEIKNLLRSDPMDTSGQAARRAASFSIDREQAVPPQVDTGVPAEGKQPPERSPISLQGKARDQDNRKALASEEETV